MGHFATTTRQVLCASFGISGIATSVFALSAVLALSDGAHAANKPAPPPPPASEADQKKIAAAAARRAYDSGVQDYASGKHQAAVDQLSTALRGGGLSSAEMAKALYLRGVSYKKLSKPGLAISDLTSALWLKNGLGEADQKIAMAERAEAYRMAGLGDGNSGADKVAVADPNPSPAGSKAVAPPAAAPTAAAVPAAPIPAPIPGPAAASAAAPTPSVSMATADVSSGQITRQSPDSEAARDAANARRNAAQPVETGLQSVATATVVGDAFTGPPAASPVVTAPGASHAESVASLSQSTISSPSAPAPALSAAPIEEQAQPAAPVTSSGGGIGGFFSNLFSSGSSSPPPAPESPASVTTASTSPPPATSSWSDTTSIASGNAKTSKPVQVAAAAPHPPIPVAAPAAAAPALKGGKYKLHIAAVRSREEADALAQKLASQQGAALKSRIPVVDEAVIGSMGKFYRVRVGSYANPDEPRGVCNTLRSSGYDCLVVTN